MNSDPPPSPSADNPPKFNRGLWLFLHWVMAGIVVIPACLIAYVLYNHYLVPKENLLQNHNNCRQILIALKSYSADHNGQHPTGATSNDAFRELFRLNLIDSERVFSARASPYVGDEEFGSPPGYLEALKPGENHWAMLDGITDSTLGNAPLVFENAVPHTWPPKWDMRSTGQPKPGRVSSKLGRIIIGRNDGSANLEQLDLKAGDQAPLEKDFYGRELFTHFATKKQLLDVARQAQN